MRTLNHWSFTDIDGNFRGERIPDGYEACDENGDRRDPPPRGAIGFIIKT